MTPIPIHNRYLLHESLGQGAMGIVYRATDRLSGDTVAIKRVTVPGEQLQFASRSNAKTNEDIKLALAQEFQTLASLRHPNIISVLGYGFDEMQQPYFTMSYLPKAQTILDASLHLDEKGKVNLLIQMLQALAYLHRRHILHRDLKPANVLVTENGLRVLDFGLSVSREQARGRTGTLAYMAPEILRKGQATEASDLYAIGVIAYQIFAGELPFEPTDIMGILSRPADLQKLKTSPELRAVIEQLLQKSPAARGANAYALIAAFNNAIESPIPEEDTAIRESFLQAAKFVGREAELAQLLGALEDAGASRGSGWLVGSESGVGKTRLLEELRIRALVQGAQVWRGQAIEDQGRPYRILLEPLRRLSLMGQMSALQSSVLKPIIPDIEALLDQEIPNAPELDEKEAAQRLALTIVDVLETAVLATPPILLLLEDLHWGLESLDVLAALNQLAAKLPLLVVGTFRTEETPDLPEKLPQMQTLLLSRFEPQAIADLSASMLGDAGTQPSVLALLQEETEGNVFFLVETVRALAEEAGSLQSVGSSTLPQAVFAGGVQRIIQRRLARVPAAYRPLLQFAAVTGRELELDLLQTATPEMPLETWLTACANVAVLEVHEERWRFAHDKLRQAALADLADDESRALHHQVAETIENTYADHLAINAGRLAWHYAQANAPEKERFYARLAGEQAAAQFSNDEALRFFEQALARTPESALDDQIALLLAQETIYKLQGKTNQREANLDALDQLASQLEDQAQQAQVTLRRLDYFYECGNYPAAVAAGEQGLQWVSATQHPEIAVRIHNSLATTLRKNNNLEQAQWYVDRGLSVAREIQDRVMEAKLFITQGMIAYTKRELDSARTSFEKSLLIAQETPNSHNPQTLALNNLGMVLGYQGDFQAAQHYYEQALKIAREIGSRKLEAMNLGNLGWVSGLLGEFEQAIDYTQNHIDVAHEIGNPYNETYGWINLSAYAGMLGDQKTARQSAQRALLLARQIKDRSTEAWACTNLGHSEFASKNFEQAVDAYQRALDIRCELEQPLLATEPAAGLARVYLAQDQLKLAQQTIQPILPFVYKENGLNGTDDPVKVYLACYLVLKPDNASDAHQVLERAYHLLQNRAKNIEAEATRQSFLNGIPHHREIQVAWQKWQKEKAL